MKLLEVCVDSVESAVIAAENGADRLELCSALPVGGLTPSAGLFRAVKQQVGGKIPIFCIIRPRPEHFTYSPQELEVMKMDVAYLKDAGADGFVFGCLTESDTVDENVLQLLQLADPLPCTFHRAFDLVSDPFETLEALIKLGFKRVLTSGQKSSAIEGLELLKKLQQRANGRIILMAGAGIRSTNVKKNFGFLRFSGNS